jgi:hypothetical protein
MDGEHMALLRGMRAVIVGLFFFDAAVDASAAPFVYFTQNGSSINAIHRIDAASGASQTLQSNPGDHGLPAHATTA